MSTLPKRKHPRLKVYDYSQGGAYFITVCTKRYLCRVGRDDLGAPSVHLNALGTIVERYICSIPTAYPHVTLEHYVVMPNHIHLLLCVGESGAPGSSRPTTALIPRIVAALKRFSDREAGLDLWQASFHDHIIRNENDFLNHWQYIENNPSRWTEDDYYTQVCEEATWDFLIK